jgi:MFS family permease
MADLGKSAISFTAGIARPLGGIVFGHFGDRVGCKSMLVLSMLETPLQRVSACRI